MTRDQIAAKVTSIINDGGVHHTPVEINDAIQDVYSDLVLEHGLLSKAVAIDLDANRCIYDMVTAIPDFVALRAIFYEPNKRWLSPANLRYLNGFGEWETKNGTPAYFCPLSYRRVAIYPHPTVDIETALWVFYFASAPTLTNVSQDINIPLTAGLRAVEHGTAGLLFMRAEEFSKAELCFADLAVEMGAVADFRRGLPQPDLIPGLK